MRTVVQPAGSRAIPFELSAGYQRADRLVACRANTGDNLLRSWDFRVEDFYAGWMALNLTAQKHRWRLRMVKFSVVGGRSLEARRNGNTLQGATTVRCATLVAALLLRLPVRQYC